MTSPIRQHSTISVTANAARHRRASGTLLPGAVSRESAALTSLFILSPFRSLSINTCIHHPCIPGPDHKQAGSGKSAPVSSTNVTSSDRLRQCPFPETAPDSPPLRAPCDNKEPSPEQEVRGVSPGSGNSRLKRPYILHVGFITRLRRWHRRIMPEFRTHGRLWLRIRFLSSARFPAVDNLFCPVFYFFHTFCAETSLTSTTESKTTRYKTLLHINCCLQQRRESAPICLSF